MNTNSGKRSFRLGEFIAHVYRIYFLHDLDDRGGTDADHVAVIPGNDFPTDASQRGEFRLQCPGTRDVDGDRTLSGQQPES